MYAITGITGRVGGQLANELLDAGLPVRAVLRDAAKAGTWKARGCEVAIAAMDDVAALQAAFAGAEAVFVLVPPVFDPTPDFAQGRAYAAALVTALNAAGPDRVVCLSTVGAQARQENLLTQLQLVEQALHALPMPVAFLRAAWFMENAAWDIAPARASGVIRSFLQPLARRIPMVATADVAHAAAQLLRTPWQGRKVVELAGPGPVSPLDLAATLAEVLGRPVSAEAVPRAEWEGLFLAQGMASPGPRMRMIEGFNEGWICFEHPEVQRGSTSLEAVLRDLAGPESQ